MAAMKACLALAAIAALVPSAAHAELSAATTNAKRAYFVRTSGSHAPSPAPTSLDAVDGGGLGGSFHLNVEAGAAPVGRNGKTMPYAAVDVGKGGAMPRWSDDTRAFGVCVVTAAATAGAAPRDAYEVLLTSIVAGDASGLPTFASPTLPSSLLSEENTPLNSQLAVTGCRLFFAANAAAEQATEAHALCFHDPSIPGEGAESATLSGPLCVQESMPNFEMRRFRLLSEEVTCDLDAVQHDVCGGRPAAVGDVEVRYIAETGEFVTNDPTSEGAPKYQLDDADWWPLAPDDCGHDRGFVTGPTNPLACF